MSAESAKTGEREHARERRLVNFAHLGNILFEITLELGRKELSLREAAQLQVGDVIELDKLAGEAFEIRANDHLFAEGEVVVVTDLLACRITRLGSGT